MCGIYATLWRGARRWKLKTPARFYFKNHLTGVKFTLAKEMNRENRLRWAEPRMQVPFENLSKGLIMPRINIESTLFTDVRFLDLVSALGSFDLALGALVHAWLVAQRWYTTPERTIPIEEWGKQRLNDAIVTVGLATIHEGRVRISGAENQFAWLLERREAGRRGGMKRVKNAAVKQTQAQLEQTKQTQAQLEQTKQTQANEPSYSSSYSSSSSSSSSNSLKKKKTKNANADAFGDPAPSQKFISAYVQAYKTKYGTGARPHLGGRTQGEIKRLLADIPIDRACALIETYCAMRDPWFETKAHDITTFIANLAKVGVALDTGHSTNAVQLQMQQKEDYFEAQRERLKAGLI
jgi:hypothetical protein